ncbi:hypothetical protein N5U26_06525 [Aliarcobacter cryaerophilus]|uniref:hypothetical protein n=1 Tax=Aliarcobacter cryaerophilus TaxID=28198 RepID=UPI0021B5DBCB|nr:hypothetical protein [Aliarcobacter cryaerophilus]MCT7509998.1 hypothetical protein [Aliarcobacter cryaerophilus]
MTLIVLLFMLIMIGKILSGFRMLIKKDYKQEIDTNEALVSLTIFISFCLFAYAFYILLLESLSKV